MQPSVGSLCFRGVPYAALRKYTRDRNVTNMAVPTRQPQCFDAASSLQYLLSKRIVRIYHNKLRCNLYTFPQFKFCRFAVWLFTVQIILLILSEEACALSIHTSDTNGLVIFLFWFWIRASFRHRNGFRLSLSNFLSYARRQIPAQ